MWKNIGKGGIWFAIYFGLQNVVSMVFAFVYTLMQSGNMPDVTDVDALMDFILDVVYATTLPALAVASILMILVYVLYKRKKQQPLDIKSVNWRKMMFFAGVGCITNVVISWVLNIVYNFVPESLSSLLEQSTSLVSTGHQAWLLLLGTGILVPIMEELTFRYGLHRNIAKSNVVWAYIISSIAFGLMHGNPLQIAYATLIGVLLAFVYQKTDNIWYPIIIHASINTTSVIWTFFDESNAFAFALLGVGVLLIVLAFIAKTCSNKRIATT